MASELFESIVKEKAAQQQALTGQTQPVATASDAAPSALFSRLAAQRANAEAPATDQWKGVRAPNAIERFGRGMVDVTDGVQQLWLQVTNPEKAAEFQKNKDAELAIYDAGAGDGFDWMRLGGQAVATAPAAMVGGAPATLLGRTALGAAQGAAATGALYTKEGESRIGNAVTGAVGGAAVPLAFKALGASAGKVWGGLQSMARQNPIIIKSDQAMMKALSSLGLNMSDMSDAVRRNLVAEARKQLSAGGKIDADALGRKQRMEDLGFVGDAGPTQSQVTRSPQQWAAERNLSKTEEGEELVGRYMNQDARFKQLMDEVIGDVPPDVDAGNMTFDAVNKLWKSSQDKVGSLYKEIRSSVGDSGAILPDKLLSAIERNRTNLTGRKIWGSVDAEIERLLKDKDGLTLSEAEELRKWIGSLADGNDPNLLRLKSTFKDALDDDVIDQAGSDAFKQARDAARDRFKAFETKLVKSIVDDNSSPDKAFKRLLNADEKDIAGLKSNLLSTPEGAKAWEQIRKQVVASLWEKAQLTSMGTTEQFSGTNFQKALKALGVRRINHLFSKEEADRLYQIAEAGINLTRTPPYSAVNWSNTAPAAYEMMKRMSPLPFIGDAIAQAGKRGAQQAQVQQALTGPAIDTGLSEGARQAMADAIANAGTQHYFGLSPQGLLSTGVPLGLLNSNGL